MAVNAAGAGSSGGAWCPHLSAGWTACRGDFGDHGAHAAVVDGGPAVGEGGEESSARSAAAAGELILRSGGSCPRRTHGSELAAFTTALVSIGSDPAADAARGRAVIGVG